MEREDRDISQIQTQERREPPEIPDKEAALRRRRRAALRRRRARRLRMIRRLIIAGAALLLLLLVFFIVRAVSGGKDKTGDLPEAETQPPVETAVSEEPEQPEEEIPPEVTSPEVTPEEETPAEETVVQPESEPAAEAPAQEENAGETPAQATEEPQDAPPQDIDIPQDPPNNDVMTEEPEGVQTDVRGTDRPSEARGTAPEPLSEEVASFHSGYVFSAEGGVEEIESETVQSSYALIVDVDSGRIIAGKGYEERINPASMTKILTLLVAVEHLSESQLAALDEETFEITDEIFMRVYKADSSVAGWYPGDTPTLEDLLYGTILPSGADAAMGLAEYTAGSEEAFVGWMNDKLKELGLSDTAHFTNCIGLYDEEHYCTLTDMAAIMKAAVENDLCREVLSAHTYTTSPTENAPDGLHLSNWFLRRIEDKDTHGEVIGAKTGFVDESGNCAASYQISDDGGHYICVTANAWSAWRCIYDHVEIYVTYTE